MSIDLTQFHGGFYEESHEALSQMEAALLRLDAGAPDPELVNTIFRVAHSIKGGAATFGFAAITSFTHTLESVLDALRAQRIKVTQSLSDLLLRSVDLLRELLRAQQMAQSFDAQRVADLQFDLERVIAPLAAGGPASGSAVRPAVPQLAPAVAPGETTYEILFRPFLHMLARGNDPLRMFRELRELGTLEVEADLSALPPLAELDAENCHLSWRLLLTTAAPRQSVLEVFDWAEGDCELEINAQTPPAAATLTAAAAAAPAVAPAAPAPAASQNAVSGTAPPVSVAATTAAETSSIRVSVDKIDDLMNSVGELVITQSMLSQFGPLLTGVEGERLRAAMAQLERNVRELQESVMRVRMVPISFVFSRFPRMVRDLAQRLGKQVTLTMSGGDTELDKTVLEKIGDPLIHLIRNSIDHGIEAPEVRRAAGKPPGGTVQLRAYHRGSSITVEVSDDGGGLKHERILFKARERGLVGPNEQPSDAEICNLIFVAGFSTQDQATEVSGRGVGMDVVRRNVEELGGSIEVKAQSGLGARFTITLPLTLAIVDGQTVAVGDESYIVPLTAIVESLQMSTASLSSVVGHGEVLSFRGEYLPLLRLQQLFDARSVGKPADDGLIMVVEGDGRRVGLCIDELLGQQQVVVKTLEANYGRVDGIAGATILGNGSVALILDIATLARSVAERRAPQLTRRVA